MDFDKFYRLLAAPLAAVFLLLVLSFFVYKGRPSQGLEIELIQSISKHVECPYVDREIVANLRSDGSTWISETPIPENQYAEEIRKIEQNRKEKKILLIIDPNVSYQEATDFVNEIAKSTDHLQIGFFSRRAVNEMYEHGNNLGCGVIWPQD